MSRKRRRRRSGVPVCLAAGAVLAVAGYWQFVSTVESGGTRTIGSDNDHIYRAVRSAALHERQRPIYPHSIIRGGAYSPVELAQALENDSVAAAHYAGFRSSAAHLDRLDRPRLVYVSYRVGDAVRWTKNRVPLPAGEAVLTDGEHLARARCGNRISFTPQQPVGPDVEMDLPEPPPAADVLPTADGAPDLSTMPLLVHEIFPTSDVASPNGGAILPGTTEETPGVVGGTPGGGPDAPPQGGGYAGGFGTPWVGGLPILSHAPTQVPGGPDVPQGPPSIPSPSPDFPLSWRPSPIAFSFTPPPTFSQNVPPDSPNSIVPGTPYTPFTPLAPGGSPPGDNPPSSSPPGDIPPGGGNPPGDNPPGDIPPGTPPPDNPAGSPPPSGPPPDVPPPPVDVPEPATQLLYGAGLIALGIAGRKIRR